MTFTYDDGEAIFTGDEIEVTLRDWRHQVIQGLVTVLQIRKDGKRIRVQHISDFKDTIEWVDTKGCEMIRRSQ